MLNRYEKAIRWIRSNLGEIIASQRIYSGINSDVWRIEGKDFCISLKLYKIYNQKHYKYKREIDFINFLNKYQIKSVPKIIAHDDKNNYAIYQWIFGSNPEKIDDRMIDEIAIFLSSLKNIEGFADENGISNASEACLTSNDFAKHIDNRIRNIQNKAQNNNRIKTLYKQSIEEEVINYEKNIRKCLLTNKIKDFIIKPGRFLTQSDMGIHNIIIGSDGCCYFVDFEHSGWDSIIKTAADLILQPNHKYSSILAKNVIKTMSSYFSIDYNISDDWSYILKAQRLKWSLIMLNPLMNEDNLISEEFERKLIIKIQNYLYSTREIIVN